MSFFVQTYSKCHFVSVCDVCKCVCTLLPSTWPSSRPPEPVSRRGTGPCLRPGPALDSASSAAPVASVLPWPSGWEPPILQGTLGSDWVEREEHDMSKHTANTPHNTSHTLQETRESHTQRRGAESLHTQVWEMRHHGKDYNNQHIHEFVI